jgi:hypothetical protein
MDNNVAMPLSPIDDPTVSPRTVLCVSLFGRHANPSLVAVGVFMGEFEAKE